MAVRASHKDIRPHNDYEIDWGNWFSRGLKYCFLTNNRGFSLVNLVDGRRAVPDNTDGDLSKTVTNEGRVVTRAVRGTDNWAVANPYVMEVDVGTTIFVRARALTDNFAFSLLASPSAAKNILVLNQGTGMQSEYNEGFSETAAGLNMPEATWVNAGWTLNSSGKLFFIDDAFEQETPARAGKTTTIAHIGRGSAADRGWGGDIGLVLGWERDFSQPKIVEFQKNPYQIFRQRGKVRGTYRVAAAGVTAALTGTALDSITEADTQAGGKVITIAITGDTLKAAGTGPIGTTAQSQALLDGITSDGVEGTGWNAEVRDNLVPADDLVRTDDNTATVNLPASAGHDITAQETITITVPTDVLVLGAGALVATPTFTVDQVVTGRIMGSLANQGGLAGMGGIAGSGGGLAG